VVAEGAEDVALDQVGVLVLVDQDVVELPGQHRPHRRVPHRGTPVEQEVLEVEQVLGALALRVAGEDRAQSLDVVEAPREEPGHGLLEGVWLLTQRP